MKPISLRSLKDKELFNGRAGDVIEDINLFLGWSIAEKAIKNR